MLLFKWTFLFLICYISSYIGFQKSKTYDYRVNNLKKFQSALNMLKSKIEFTHEPIKSIFDDISMTIYSSSENIFKNTIIDNNFYNNWCKSIDKSNESFNDEDKEIIKAFGKQLRKNRYKRTT